MMACTSLSMEEKTLLLSLSLLSQTSNLMKLILIYTSIIAVHGLAANPVYTWIKRVPANNEKDDFGRVNNNGEREVMWLKHLLPAVIPSARILKYNYGSSYLVNAPKECLRSLAERLANTIRNLRGREEDTTKRPLIFIGHSFGGIVIQEV